MEILRYHIPNISQHFNNILLASNVAVMLNNVNSLEIVDLRHKKNNLAVAFFDRRDQFRCIPIKTRLFRAFRKKQTYNLDAFALLQTYNLDATHSLHSK